MNVTVKSEWLSIRNVVIAALGAVLMYFLVTSIINDRFDQVEQNTRAEITAQQLRLSEIAVTTARNGADPITEKIIHDCSSTERNKFDTLLGSLNDGLKHSQLVELERLFGRCGGFFSERKAVMVSRLTREIEIYDTYVKHLSVITGQDQSEEFQVADWRLLAAAEQKRSDYLMQLVSLQDKIISTLLAGLSTNSTEISSILHEVSEVQGTLVVVNQQIADIRNDLVSL